MSASNEYTKEQLIEAGRQEFLKGLPCIPSYWQAASYHRADEDFIKGYKEARNGSRSLSN